MPRARRAIEEMSQRASGQIRGTSTPPPTVEGQRILEMAEQLKTDFKARNDLYRRVDEVIYLQQAVRIPDAYAKSAVEVRSPFPLHIVNNITAALTINAPSVHFDPIGLGDPGIENQSLRQKYFVSSWERQQQEAGRRLFRMFGHAVTTYGEGILKTSERKKLAWAGYDSYSKKLWGDLNADADLDPDTRDRVYNAKTEEYKRGAPYPIATTDVLPHTFHYWRGENGFSICAEIKEVPYLDTMRRYKAAFDREGRIVPQNMGLPETDWHRVMGRRRTITMIEWWEWDKVTYVLQGPGDVKKRGSTMRGLEVNTVTHKYGDKHLKTLTTGPYFHCLGITTSSRKIEHQGLGVLFAFLHLFPLLNSLLTMQSQSAYSTAYPAYRRTVPEGFQAMADLSPYGVSADQADAAQTTVVEPGTILPFDVVPIDQPRSGADLDKSIAMVRSMIELAMPDVAMGNISPESSGYAINQAAHAAKLAWTPIIDNMRVALGLRVGFESWLIAKRIGEALYVPGDHPSMAARNRKRGLDGWIRIRPEDLGDAHRYTVELNPETPSNELLNLRAIAQKLQMRLISPSKAIELSGEDPYEVELAWLIDDLKKDGTIRKAFQNRTLKKISTIDAQAMAAVNAPGGQPALTTGAPQQGGPPAGAATPTGATPPLGQVNPGRGTPGVPPGAPGGIRNPPSQAAPMAGQQGSNGGPPA